MARPVRLKRWKVLKVAIRKGRPGLAMRALGFHRLPGLIRELYTPHIAATRRALRGHSKRWGKSARRK